MAWKQARGVLRNQYPDIPSEDLMWCHRAGIEIEDFRAIRDYLARKGNGQTIREVVMDMKAMLDVVADKVDNTSGLVHIMWRKEKADQERVADLEAQARRLRAAIHDLRCSVDASEFDDVVASYLHPGDLDPIGGEA